MRQRDLHAHWPRGKKELMMLKEERKGGSPGGSEGRRDCRVGRSQIFGHL